MSAGRTGPQQQPKRSTAPARLPGCKRKGKYRNSYETLTYQTNYDRLRGGDAGCGRRQAVRGR